MWGCVSFTSSECANFLLAANANGALAEDMVFLPLQDLDTFGITFDVYAAGTADCATQLGREYTGVPSS